MKPKTTLSKEELKKQLNAIIEKEEQAFIKKHLPAMKKKYEGKCFKLMNWNGSGKKWPLYVKVTKIDHVQLANGGKAQAYYYGWSFQTNSQKQIIINPNDKSFVHLLGRQIPEAEFLKAYNAMLDDLSRLQ